MYAMAHNTMLSAFYAFSFNAHNKQASTLLDFFLSPSI